MMHTVKLAAALAICAGAGAGAARAETGPAQFPLRDDCAGAAAAPLAEGCRLPDE